MMFTDAIKKLCPWPSNAPMFMIDGIGQAFQKRHRAVGVKKPTLELLPVARM